MRSSGDDGGDGYVIVPLSYRPENDSGGKLYVTCIFSAVKRNCQRGRRNKHGKWA